MKFEIYKEKMRDIILILRNSLAKSGIKPIYEHFLFEIKNKTLTVKATDTQIATVFSCDIDSEDNFSFTLHGPTLSSLLASLDNKLLHFEYNPSTNDVTLTCGNYVLDAASGDTLEFPEISIPESLKIVRLPVNFVSMLKSVSFSIGTDDSKKDLNSLCLDINKDNSGNMTMVTTDRERLSYSKTPLEEKDTVRFVIPYNSVIEIEKLCPTHLMYSPKKQRIYFKKETSSGIFVFQTVLTNEDYPDIYNYLTDAFEEGKIVKIKRKEVMRILKRISLTSDKLNKIGTIDFKNGRMVLSSLNASIKSKEEIDIETPSGTPNPFNINISYILDYLSQENLEEVHIKVIDNSCLVFDKENYRHVLAVNS